MRRWAWVVVGGVVAAVAVTGCSSTRMVQRDGCWIRQTETFPKQVNEEIGPCAKPEPKWSEDRLARLVQECVAAEDHRWHNRAVEAFNRKQPIPAPADTDTVLQRCMSESANTMITENESLKSRMGELTADREGLKAMVEEDRAHFRETHKMMTAALGEAAKKPAPSATATATSTGTARTESDTRTQSDLKSDLKAPPQTTSTTVTSPPVTLPRPTRAVNTCTPPVKKTEQPKVVAKANPQPKPKSQPKAEELCDDEQKKTAAEAAPETE